MRREREYCDICMQHVEDPGPWCVLYVDRMYCKKVIEYRRAIRAADSKGDGALVNGLCHVLRTMTNDNFVP